MEDGQKKRGKMTLSMCGVECMSAKIYYLTRRFLCISLFTWCVLIYWLIWNYHTTSWFFVIYSLSFVFIVAFLHIFLCVGLCLRNMLCLDLFWKSSMFLIWIAGCAVSFVAIFFYGYKKVTYISNDGDSESPTSACQIRMPATNAISNETRPTVYEGVFSCDFYDGMLPFSPVFCILATLVILFFSCNSCVLGQKISLIALRKRKRSNNNKGGIITNVIINNNNNNSVSNNSIYNNFMMQSDDTTNGNNIQGISNNYNNWISDFYDSETSSINFDFEDEIIQSSVLVYQGKIKNERFQ